MSVSRNSRLVLSTTALSAVFFAGCGSGSTQHAAKQQYIDASQAGKMAMEMYDKNGDGVVSGPELENSPSLKEALPRLDTNGDKGVSADEVAARVNAWKDLKSGLISGACHVTLDGEPLTGATVVFEPEAFLGDQTKKAEGVTNPYGNAAPTLAKEDRPDPKSPSGAQLGLYLVRISKVVNGKETIPAQYNTQTTLGQELSADDPAIKNNNLQFNLKSKP